MWTPNRAAVQCAVCARHFDMLFLRKHHCRSCGACVCAPCSAHRVELAWVDPKARARAT